MAILTDGLLLDGHVDGRLRTLSHGLLLDGNFDGRLRALSHGLLLKALPHSTTPSQVDGRLRAPVHGSGRVAGAVAVALKNWTRLKKQENKNKSNLFMFYW
jgi:hypothetical protein